MLHLEWGLIHMWSAYDTIMLRLIELNLEYQFFELLPDLVNMEVG